METNGTVWRACMELFHVVTVSPKGLEGWWRKGRCSLSFDQLVLKVVYDPDNPQMMGIMDRVLTIPVRHKFLQPLESQADKTTNVKEVIELVKKNPRWRLSLQSHKILGLR